jgi:hypothetical protein
VKVLRPSCPVAWLVLIFFLPCAAWAQDPQARPPYLDPTLTPEQIAAREEFS